MLRNAFSDKEFINNALKLALPLVLQQWIQASLGFVDMLMVGQLGDVAVAAIGLGNQYFFLLHVLTFGIGSGTAIFTAQFWGQRELPSIRRTLGFSLCLSAVASSLFAIPAIFFPETVMGIYTKDAAVIVEGSRYLRIVGFCFFFTSCSFCYIAILRSMQNIKLPIFVSLGALSLNTLLSYLLIFGHLGLPRLGVRGAAIAITISYSLEFCIIVPLCYLLKTPLAARLKEIFIPDWLAFRKYFRTSIPVLFNELAWSLGMAVYTVVYAHIGTDAIAAINISSSLEQIGFVTFIGLSNACAVMIGNRIGAGEEHKAYEYAVRFLVIGFIGAFLLGALVFILTNPVLVMFQISDSARANAHNILRIFSFTLWLRVLTIIFFIGILRSGGDTRFSFLLDLLCVWLIGVPLALFGAFVLHLTVYWVYLMVLTEEFIKLFILLRRFVSRRWINNLARPVTVLQGIDPGAAIHDPISPIHP